METLITPQLFGLGDPYPVSAVHGIGTGDVLEHIVQQFPC
ncbi:hypothetical protein LMG8526HA_01117 [Lactococcus lactis]|nr:hypothetical protein [Lactococcus lactis]